MKGYQKVCAAVIAILIVIFVVCNSYIIFYNPSGTGRIYRTEANRVAYEIEQNGFDKIDLSRYGTITAVFPMNEKNENTFFQAESDYVIREVEGTLYRIEYTVQVSNKNTKLLMIVNASLLGMAFLIAIVLLFIHQRILKPFYKLREVPYELSKGNLTVPIQENKNRFFGRFTWGIDLLRENLEQQKQREMELQKEKKTLLLSISHDIKTPLSAIKLYAKALSKGLYKDKQKQLDIAENINAKADEIEKFVSEIIKASSGDFLNLEVHMGEFYLSEAIDKISDYYTDKLSFAKINFSVGSYINCILKGDLERLVEVLQNVIENAVKYGNGHDIALLFSEEEDCCFITVQNSGCTLPGTELPYIFDSFWRGSNVGSNGGSGLGLYICRQLMHKMDGEVFAEMHETDMRVTAVIHKA